MYIRFFYEKNVIPAITLLLVLPALLPWKDVFFHIKVHFYHLLMLFVVLFIP
ncbi:hypothetical protein N824_15655 [Pedobacter sp. V48]|nr:hypothetical protein N824_15655 [Pedobacter sp. V48]